MWASHIGKDTKYCISLAGVPFAGSVALAFPPYIVSVFTSSVSFSHLLLFCMHGVVCIPLC